MSFIPFEKHLRQFDTAPFLFVGSGISSRYIGGPSWEDVLKTFSIECGKDYEYYRSTNNNDLLRIASNIAEDFHKIWWENSKYKRSRERNKENAINKQSAFKIAISENLKLLQRKSELEKESEEIEMLGNVNIDGVITTNWDSLIEQVFPNFVSYIGQDDIIFNNTYSVGEIFKIHGCISDPNSIVVTHEDYEKFDKRNVYLASKLLAIFVEHPIIFLGYSLRDPNVQQIMRSIIDCLDGKQLEKLRDRLIFIIWDSSIDSNNFDRSEIIVKGFSMPIIRYTVKDYIEPFAVLSSVKRQIPLKLLRKMKESVYEIASSTEPKSKITVVNMEEIENFDDIEYVVGIGIREKIAEIGIKAINRDYLLDDILFDNNEIDSVQLVEQVLPEIFKRSEHVPIYKYLNKAGIDVLRLEEQCIDKKIIKRHMELPQSLLLKGYYQKKRITINKDILTPNDFYDRHGLCSFLYYYIGNQGLDVDNIKEFRELLIKIKNEMKDEHSLLKSSYLKMICYLDIMENCPAKMLLKG